MAYALTIHIPISVPIPVGKYLPFWYLAHWEMISFSLWLELSQDPVGTGQGGGFVSIVPKP